MSKRSRRGDPAQIESPLHMKSNNIRKPRAPRPKKTPKPTKRRGPKPKRTPKPMRQRVKKTPKPRKPNPPRVSKKVILMPRFQGVEKPEQGAPIKTDAASSNHHVYSSSVPEKLGRPSFDGDRSGQHQRWGRSSDESQ